MGERVRGRAQRRGRPVRADGPARDDAEHVATVEVPTHPLLRLHQTAGNRAVAGFVVQRGAGPGIGTALPTTVQDLTAAEQWIRYVALRGNSARPAVPVPHAYRGRIAALQSAIGGPGPIPAKELVIDELAFGEARGIVKLMRADHARLLPKADAGVYDLAELAIDRGQANFKAGPDSFEGGANQLDQGQILLAIWSSADDELEAAKQAGYQIPQSLAELPSEAKAQLDAARTEWGKAGPSDTRLTTPAAEMDLILFATHAADVVNAMRRRRAVDTARARAREAGLLEAAAEKQMAELRALLADKRRSAFMAGERGTLKKVSEALGQIAGAIEDTRAAARIVTDQVDRLNAVVALFGMNGTGLIELPKLPAGISAVADRLTSANDKLKKIVEVLDLAGPAKTKLDEGLKYLKGTKLALEHLAGRYSNPFLAVYVDSYLAPGIENCIASIGTISNIVSSQNRSLIEAGGRWALHVNWAVEPGGRSMYLFLAEVHRSGGAARLSDAAWVYLADHRGELSAAVGVAMPKDRRSVPAWASTYRKPLWESFYGSTKPPR